MDKKYEINSDGRVVALRDFGNVKAGDVGGVVESENNLSHDGDCWVSDDAWVYGNARVSGNAEVYVNAQVSGDIGDISVCGELKNKYRIDISEDKVVSAVSAGGPAFPFQDGYGRVSGMTLRDWFATHATEADILAAQGAYRVVTRYEARYIHADEMLKARGQG